MTHKSCIVTKGMILGSSLTLFKEMESNPWAAVQFYHRFLCHLNVWWLLLFSVWFVQLHENPVEVVCGRNLFVKIWIFHSTIFWKPYFHWRGHFKELELSKLRNFLVYPQIWTGASLTSKTPKCVCEFYFKTFFLERGFCTISLLYVSPVSKTFWNFLLQLNMTKQGNY